MSQARVTGFKRTKAAETECRSYNDQGCDSDAFTNSIFTTPGQMFGVKIITNPLLAWFRVTRRHIGSVINKKLFGENAFSLDVVLPAVICDFAK